MAAVAGDRGSVPAVHAAAVVLLTDLPEWCEPLLAALRAAGVPAATAVLGVDWAPPAAVPDAWRVIVNRLSARPTPADGEPLAATVTRHRDAITAVAARALAAASSVTSDDDAHDRLPLLVLLNGDACHAVAVSKVAQAAVFAAAGATTPETIPVSSSRQATAQAAARGGRWLLKANVGGKGAGIRFVDPSSISAGDAAAEKDASAAEDVSTFGADGTAVLQRYVVPAGGVIYRAEVVGGRVLYVAATPVPPPPPVAGAVGAAGKASFNNCLGDVCAARPAASRPTVVPLASIPAATLRGVRRVATAAAMDIGSVEFLFPEPEAAESDASLLTSDRALYFDINPVSTLVPESRLPFGWAPPPAGWAEASARPIEHHAAYIAHRWRRITGA